MAIWDSRHVAAIALACGVLLPGAAAAGQAANPSNVVEELKSPPAPALHVLGLAPTKIDRPQGVRAIVASIVAASKDTGFPRNYSVEVSPYWLGTPTLSFDEYLPQQRAESVPPSVGVRGDDAARRDRHARHGHRHRRAHAAAGGTPASAAGGSPDRPDEEAAGAARARLVPVAAAAAD